MPYQDISGTVVNCVSSYYGYNEAVGSLWKESITNFLLTAARGIERKEKDLTLGLHYGKQASIRWHGSFFYARGNVGQVWPTFEPEETLFSGCSPEDMKSKLFDFVHGPRRMLVINFAVLGFGSVHSDLIDKLYLWKSPKDRQLHVAASYR